MKPRDEKMPATSRSSLAFSARKSESKSVCSNKYTDSLREKRDQGDHLKDENSSMMENSFVSGRLPKTWFNIGPLSEEFASNQEKTPFKSSLSGSCRETLPIPESKFPVPPGVQLIKLTFKDRQPGSSKRVSAGSQDRQTATRDESSRIGDLKEKQFVMRAYNNEEKINKKKGQTPYFSFLTCSESMLGKSFDQKDRQTNLDKHSAREERVENKTSWKKQKPHLEIETTLIELRTVDVCVTDSTDRNKNKVPELREFSVDGLSLEAQSQVMQSYLRSSLDAGKLSVGLMERKTASEIDEQRLRKSVLELFKVPERKINLRSIFNGKPT